MKNIDSAATTTIIIMAITRGRTLLGGELIIDNTFIMYNLVIKYGFQSIIPNFIFPNNKGGHVFNVEEHRLVLLFDKQLDDARNLKYASCQCPAGSGKDGTSKTDEPQQWGKASKMGEKMYNKGKQISELFLPKRLKLDIKSLTHNELIQHHNLLKIPCTLSLNLIQEKRTDIERTCQN
ncbi:Uncharacterized protein FWK35_00032987, partial [Aphis craccivora]